MSTPSNVTSASSDSTAHVSLLWIPYVLIALVFIVFLGANFWCYHKKNRERYLRKRDEKRVKDGLHERRRITALMRSHFQTAFMAKNNEDGGGAGEEPDKAMELPVVESSGAVVTHHHVPSSAFTLGGLGAGEKQLSPGVHTLSSPVQLPLGDPPPPWTSQNGACRTSGGGVCSVKSETSNGVVLH